jgi:hypothetical protein
MDKVLENELLMHVAAGTYSPTAFAALPRRTASRGNGPGPGLPGPAWSACLSFCGDWPAEPAQKRQCINGPNRVELGCEYDSHSS